MVAIDISDLCALGLVLAGREALRVVKSGAATVETYKYCVPVEDLGNNSIMRRILSTLTCRQSHTALC